MSILIKGITKPTDCILCPMFRGAWQMCGLLNREVYPKGTPKNCPLVELPAQHGRLVDAYAMQGEWYRLNFNRKISDGTLAYWNFQLSKMPTVIEAEGEDV